VVAATQGVVLVAVTTDVLPRSWERAATIAALALLVESFGRDVLWLRHARQRRRGRPAGQERGQPLSQSRSASRYLPR
jgi:hypothetical protein